MKSVSAKSFWAQHHCEWISLNTIECLSRVVLAAHQSLINRLADDLVQITTLSDGPVMRSHVDDTFEPLGLAENFTKFFFARGEMRQTDPLMRKGRSGKSGELHQKSRKFSLRLKPTRIG